MTTHPRSEIMRIAFWLLLMGVALVGCSAGDEVRDTGAEAPPVRLTAETRLGQTILGLGAGQGVEVRDGKVYAYGDADTGVIVELERLPADPSRLHPTGRVVHLTRDGEDLLPHPTGLTHHPYYGTWIGDTVDQRGTLYLIDWATAWADGNLDDAVIHVVEDDAAVNGTRPEFVEYRGRWLIATSDYDEVDNAVRLYDPERLLTARRTSEDGVEVASFACTPFVQTLHWAEAADAPDTLVLVQNITPGRGWRLTPVRGWSDARFAAAQPFDGFPHADELEGFHVLPDGETAVFITAHRHQNAWLGTASIEPVSP